jgi:hypothetical protein
MSCMTIHALPTNEKIKEIPTILPRTSLPDVIARACRGGWNEVCRNARNITSI